MSVLLTYSQFFSDPEFVAGETVSLWLEISNPPTSSCVTVSGFEIRVPPSGDCAGELSDDVSAIIAVGPSGWSTTLGPSFQFIPPDGSFEVLPDTTLTLQLTSVAINDTPGGPVVFTIVEGTQEYPSITRQLTKAPPGFSVGPLIANPPTTDNYPGSTTLSWNGSDNPQYSPSYSLQWAQDGCKINKTNLPAIEPGYPVNQLTSNTPFTLTVEYTVDEVKHYLFRSATVSVPVPAPTAKLTATPEWFSPGDSSIKLVWDVEHASKAIIEPDIGEVSNLKSSQVVHPTVKTTYTLTASVLPGFAGPPAIASAIAQPYSYTKFETDGGGGGVTVTPDGKTLYVMSYWITAYDIATRTRTEFLSMANGLPLPEMAPDGSRIYMVGLNNNSIATLDIATNAWGPTIGLPINVNTLNQGIALAPNGALLVAAEFRGSTVQAVDVSQPQMVLGPRGKAAADSVAFSPDSQWVYAMSSGSGITRLQSSDMSVVVTNQAVRGNTMAAVCASPSGSTVYVTQAENIIQLNALSLTEINRVTLTDVSVVKMVATSQWLFAVSIGQGIFVLDAASLKTVATFPSPKMTNPVPNLAIGPDKASAYWTIPIPSGFGPTTSGPIAILEFP